MFFVPTTRLGDPAFGWEAITPNDGADNVPDGTRAIRFDVGGTVAFNACINGGTPTTLSRHVVAGELWSVTNRAITRILQAGTSAQGIDALL